jgi:hypothetical protein
MGIGYDARFPNQNQYASPHLTHSCLCDNDALTVHSGQSTAGKTMSTTTNVSSPKGRISALADKYDCPTLRARPFRHFRADVACLFITVLPRLPVAVPQCLGHEMERSARSRQLPCRSRALDNTSHERMGSRS